MKENMTVISFSISLIPYNDICQTDVGCGHKQGPTPALFQSPSAPRMCYDYKLSGILSPEHKRAGSREPLVLGQLNNSTEQSDLVSQRYLKSQMFSFLSFYQSSEPIQKNEKYALGRLYASSYLCTMSE